MIPKLFCVDCKHYRLLKGATVKMVGPPWAKIELSTPYEYRQCWAYRDPVTGKVVPLDARNMRETLSCGPAGRLFEPLDAVAEAKTDAA